MRSMCLCKCSFKWFIEEYTAAYASAQDFHNQSQAIMYLPALLHNSYFAIILCGLITISHATLDKHTQDTIVDGQRTASGSGGGNGAGSASSNYASSQHPRPHHQQQQYAYHQQQQSKVHQTTSSPLPPLSPSSQGGSGAHSDSMPARHNSYTLLSKAMSEAVNHEFSKWSGHIQNEFLYNIEIGTCSVSETRCTYHVCGEFRIICVMG